MSTTTPAQWLEQAVRTIPLRTEEVFGRLWDEGRLRLTNGATASDAVDRANAQLASSTLELRRRLLVVLPDAAARRSPLLFAGALVAQWWDRRNLRQPPGRVLYFGTTVGIREHLSHVRVENLSLGTVFPQSRPNSRVKTKVRLATTTQLSGLPEVICAYSPADPISLIEEYSPVWIAIDCGDAGQIRWLPLVLRHAREQQIPVIAWGRNPLSDVLREFTQIGDGELIRWPFRSPTANSQVIPLIVEDADGDIDQCLVEAYRLLARASAQRGSDRLASDAIGIAWRLHRSIEQLSVPLDLFESEADQYWGVQRLTKLLDGTQRFAEVLSASGHRLGRDISDALALHSRIIDSLRDREPPLWCALRQLCIEDADVDRGRVIVFPSEARRRIFALALLARFNISEEDLQEAGTHLSSLIEFQKSSTLVDESAFPNPPGLDRSKMTEDRSLILASLPTAASSTRMLPVLMARGFEALIYPYQMPILARHVGEWSAALCMSPAEVGSVVMARSGTVPSTTDLSDSHPITIGEARIIPVSTGTSKTRSITKVSPIPLDEIAELSWLLGDDEDQKSIEVNPDLLHDEEEVVWTQEAIEVRLSDGWRGLFASDDTVNVIKLGVSGQQIEERFVRSLRPRDRLLYIHGQRRQSLYELVLSRVHGHPAIEIHLALITRWRDELTQSFRKHQASGLTVDSLLVQLGNQGSAIGSAQAIRLWLNGRTIAPIDPNDLLRLAELLDMPFVRQYYKRIDRAAERIRGLHRGLSIRLNRWLRDQAAGSGDAAFEVFDGELGLSFQDFRDSLTVLTVEAVQTVSGPFLARHLGTLERGA